MTTISVLHNAQLLLNKQQRIWGGVYIHWHFSSSTNTVLLLFTVTVRDRRTSSKMWTADLAMGRCGSQNQKNANQTYDISCL